MLTEEDNGEYTFTYDSSYLEKEDYPSVSLTLPLREEPYRSTVLFPFFFNMLSEGENRKLQSQLLHIDAEDDFGILLALSLIHISMAGRSRKREEVLVSPKPLNL